jgi:hypothetical protein
MNAPRSGTARPRLEAQYDSPGNQLLGRPVVGAQFDQTGLLNGADHRCPARNAVSFRLVKGAKFGQYSGSRRAASGYSD